MKNPMVIKVLSALGTVLVWIPLLAPVFFGLAGLAMSGEFNFDFLMPAEFGFLAIAGAVMLIVVAILAHSQVKLIGGSIGVAVVAIVGGQVIASVTGLASGDIEPTGWQWALVVASLGVYILALAALGVGGALLSRDVFRARAGEAA